MRVGMIFLSASANITKKLGKGSYIRSGSDWGSAK